MVRKTLFTFTQFREQPCSHDTNTPSRFSEVGEPYRIFQDQGRGLVAIASQMPHLGYPGHWLFPDASPSAHRLSIYNQRDGTMLGCIPTKHPINDVCFSPDGKNVVIATGTYDGGWCFEGFLLRFFYHAGRVEQLLGQCRKVSACRYESDGSITALVRPENEEEFAEEGLDAWSIVQCVKIGSAQDQWSAESPERPRKDARMVGLPPSVPSDHGFHNVILNPTTDHRRSWQQEATRWLEEVRAEYYTGIWNLRWMNREAFDSLGNGLAIDVSWANQRERKSLILAPTGQTPQSVDCGTSDRLGPIGFPLGLDAHYFLKREGEQIVNNDDYRLWRIESRVGKSCLRRWDDSGRDFCPVVSVAYSKTKMLGAGPVWNRRDHQNLGCLAELLDIESGHSSWSVKLSCSPTCIGLSDDQQTGLVGLVDGRICFFDLATGRTIGETVLPNQSAMSVPICLSVREDKIRVGTHDGKVLLARINI